MKNSSKFEEPRTFTAECLLKGIDHEVLALRRGIATKTRMKNYLFFCIGLLWTLGFCAVLLLFLRLNRYI